MFSPPHYSSPTASHAALLSAENLVIDASSAEIGSRNSFTSAPFMLTSTKCLTFEYQQDGGPTASPELRVTVEEPLIRRETIVWRSARKQQMTAVGKATLRPTNQQIVRLAFTALYGGNKTYSMQIDNIQLEDGECTLTGETYE